MFYLFSARLVSLSLILKYGGRHPVYISKACKRTNKKQNDHAKAGAQLPVQKHPQKGTAEDRNQHINAKLSATT